MPSRIVIAKELSEIFKAVAHPDRIRLIEELSQGEIDVNTLADRLNITSSRVSQHLTQLRIMRIVDERRDGRRHLYSLLQPEIAVWIVDALDFVEGRGTNIPQAKINTVRRLWSQNDQTDTTDQSTG